MPCEGDGDVADDVAEGGGGEHRAALAPLRRGLVGALHQLFDARALERGDLDDGHAQLLFERLGVKLVAVLLHDVRHVQRDGDGNVHLQELRRQVQVALEVGRVDDVDDAVGLFIQNIVAGDDLFGRVRREGVDAGQVDDGDLLGQALVDALALVYGDARPVADVRRAARKGVEQRRFAAVGVAR